MTHAAPPPPPPRPRWVAMGVAGLPVRRLVWIFPLLALLVAAWCVNVLPFEPRYTWGLALLVPAFWCWRSIRWMDRHEAWPRSNGGPAARDRLPALFAALSLTLCVLFLVIWAWSETGHDQLYFVGGQQRIVLITGGGQLVFQADSGEIFRHVEQGLRWKRYPGRNAVEQQRFWRRSIAAQLPGPLAWIGLSFGSLGYGGATSWIVICPLWIPAALALAPAVFWIVSIRRQRRVRRRRERGLCPACGYDLRASPGRCPECGAAAQGVVRAD